jgi:hypothetical protein
MKKNVFILVAIIAVVLTSVWSCKKEKNVNENFKEEQVIPPPSEIAEAVRLRVKFTSTYASPSCEGAPCGICLGFCIYFGMTEVTPYAVLTEEESDERYDLLYGTLLSSTELKISPNININDGSGVLVIEDDFYIDPNAANSFGYTTIKVIAGSYPINYAGTPFGNVVFTVECN